MNPRRSIPGRWVVLALLASLIVICTAMYFYVSAHGYRFRGLGGPPPAAR
ncbi:MAG: hypothetical protein HRU75_09785 [Planctomycetia bacterium]|nr:MAG: hypothetical protein HRU75_09785 [Planctomycetia bacterium]